MWLVLVVRSRGALVAGLGRLGDGLLAGSWSVDWVHEKAATDGGANARRTANKSHENLRAILSLLQPTPFTGWGHGFEGDCPCCRRKFPQALSPAGAPPPGLAAEVSSPGGHLSEFGRGATCWFWSNFVQ